MSEHQDLHDRITRAGSWIEAADEFRKHRKHRHAEFLALYVAFNSLYGRRQYEDSRTDLREDFDMFLNKVKAMRKENEAAGASTLSRAVLPSREACLQLLAMPFHRDDYWRPKVDLHAIHDKCQSGVRRARAALIEHQYEAFLRPVLRRLAVLRNQIVHGSVTYGERSKGTEGLLAGLAILRVVVPSFHHLAIKHGSSLVATDLGWEPLPYPRLESRRHPLLGVVR